MKLPARLALFIWVWLAACVPPVAAQLAGQLVNKISIRYIGPPPVSDEFIRANVRIKVGEPFLIAAADEDTKNLYLTGYFRNIRVATEPDGAGVNVIYIVQGKVILTEPVIIIGNKKMSLKKIRKKITSKPGLPLDEQKLFDDAL